jgi:hypothetical protein
MEAEATAAQAREDLGIGLFGRLNPAWLLWQLEIPVLTLSNLVTVDSDPGLADAVRLLLTEQPSALSAATVFRGSRRLIVHNDAHAAERIASNLSHEAAHALLLHAPRPAIDESGCRDWQDEVEKEAAYLGGCLLIPGKAARAASRKGWTDGQVADHYGVSEWMARYRMNVSGARRVRA